MPKSRGLNLSSNGIYSEPLPLVLVEIGGGALSTYPPDTLIPEYEMIIPLQASLSSTLFNRSLIWKNSGSLQHSKISMFWFFLNLSFMFLETVIWWSFFKLYKFVFEEVLKEDRDV